MHSDKYRRVYVVIEELDENGNVVNVVKRGCDNYHWIIDDNSLESAYLEVPYHERQKITEQEKRILTSLEKFQGAHNREPNYVKKQLKFMHSFGIEFYEKILDFLIELVSPEYGMFVFPLNKIWTGHGYGLNKALDFFKIRENGGFYISAYQNGNVRTIYEDMPTRKQASYQRRKNDCHIELITLPDFKRFKVSENTLGE